MSAQMKKHPTKHESVDILHITHHGQVYEIPADIAEKYRVDQFSESIPAKSLFKNINNKYGKPGALLKGLRYRENLNQTDFAIKIGVTQSDLSKMENGKRPIGKTIAKRIAEMFDVDYRSFL